MPVSEESRGNRFEVLPEVGEKSADAYGFFLGVGDVGAGFFLPTGRLKPPASGSGKPDRFDR